MLGGVTRHVLPHLPGVPHLHVNRPLVGAIQRQRNVQKKCAARAKFVFFLLFRLINFFVVLVAVAVQHYTILFFVYVESFAFSPGPYYENLFFVIGACRVLTVSPLSNTSDGLRCGSAMVEQV